LLEEMPNIAYLIVGDGIDRCRLEENARSLGIHEHVVFAGYIPESEKADHYRLADARHTRGGVSQSGLNDRTPVFDEFLAVPWCRNW
jgi:hypothetical protein